ncbi:Fidgetin [Lonchura striata]|uniref:Fidgetin n=1 Tax=Lonchura striata TaxID=40157 RepID=A0A218UCH7_9PASE|nr:Fidgetin [Lonchura striata domestica]
MHWSPDHAQSLNQWPEQHLDVSSTTSSPAHKSELYPSTRQRFNYAWANDDISALTASNLLKRYAEKYSGVLDAPYERPPLGAYGDGAFGPVNGQKDGEPWPGAHGSDGSYALTPIHDGLAGAKGVVPPAAGGAVGLGGSAAAAANLGDAAYAGGSCGAAAGGSGALGASQEYPSGYAGTYLPSGYCAQPAAALPPPHPAGLHGSGLLQPPHASPALVPGYGSSGAVYNYAAGGYPPQPGYGGIHPPHPSASYLPSGIAAPTPIPAPPPCARPPGVPGYGYQGAGLGALAVPPLGTEAAGALKRKAFDGGGEDDGEGRYRKYGYEQPKSPYALSDNGECRGNGFGSSGESPQVAFKAGKRAAGAGGAEEPGSKYGGQQMKGMASPAYGARDAALRPAEPFEKFSPPERPKSVDPLLLELVNAKASLGSTLLRLSGAALLSTWKAEAEKILQTAESLLAARAGEDGGQASGLKSQLLSYLDDVAASMDEASRRRFGTRLYQSCRLSERELAALAQRTESFSGAELLRLCQHAGKELDLFLEWDKMYGTRH